MHYDLLHPSHDLALRFFLRVSDLKLRPFFFFFFFFKFTGKD